MAPPLLASFALGHHMPSAEAPIEAVFHVAAQTTLRGEPLAPVSHLWRFSGHDGAGAMPPARTVLRGTTGHLRYVDAGEKRRLAEHPPVLGRVEATCASLIPIRKTDAWWELAQDERRAILEERSRHIGIGLPYTAVIARRLYHSRELGEPFDFLTWFEYAPEHAPRFHELLQALRATEEWTYVDREVQFDLARP